MKIAASSILKEDINNMLSDPNIPWDDLKNSKVLVTGATGLIGGLLICTLSAANIRYNLKIDIFAHGRSIDKGDILKSEYNAKFIASDIRDPIPLNIPHNLDYVFHCAAITKSADIVAKPADVLSTEADGLRNTLNIALKHHCKSFVYLSSMEVYGQLDNDTVAESDLGYLDLTNPRSSYPESKRFCEALCVAYYTQHSLPVKIARLALTFGAGVQNDESNTRVYSQFARKALAGENIELHTQGNSISNSCYTADTIRGLLTILLKGNNGEAYNVVNPTASATIRDMANTVANDICGGNIEVVINVPDDINIRGYAPDAVYVLNADKLKALGWVPKYNLAEMYKRMIADWSEKQ